MKMRSRLNTIGRSILCMVAIGFVMFGLNFGMAQTAFAGTISIPDPNVSSGDDQSGLRARINNNPDSIKLLRFDNIYAEDDYYTGSVWLYPKDNQSDSSTLYRVNGANEQEQQQLRMLALNKGIPFETGSDVSGVHESDLYKMLTDNPSSIKTLDFQSSKFAGKVRIAPVEGDEYTIWIGASLDQDSLTKLAADHGVNYSIEIPIPYDYTWVFWTIGGIFCYAAVVSLIGLKG